MPRHHERQAQQAAEERSAEAHAPETRGGNADTDGRKRGRQQIGNAPGPQIDHRRGTHADGDDGGHQRVRILKKR